MKSKIKWIAMDVDGTLTNGKKEITPYTRQILIKAQKQGMRLILASGRTTRSLEPYAKFLQMDRYHGLLVSYNGAVVYDCTDQSILYSKCMDVKTSKQVLRHIKQFAGIVPIIDKGEYMYVENVFNNNIEYEGHSFNVLQYEARNGHYKLCEVDDLCAFVQEPLPKILTYASPHTYEMYFESLQRPFRTTLNCMYTADFYVEFTKKGVDKGTAIQHVLDAYDHTSDALLAFGDAPNDIAMIQYASVGVAMKNASSDLIAVADRLALSNEEEGVANIVKEYIEM